MGAGFIGCLEKMGDEQQVTKVLFCGQQFIASYLYTKEYLSQYSHVQVTTITPCSNRMSHLLFYTINQDFDNVR